MLYSSLILSGLLLAVTNIVAGRASRPRTLVACCLAGCGLVLAPVFGQLAALNALLVLIAGLICLVAGSRPYWFLKSSLIATALTYAINMAATIPEFREWSRLKGKYPIESLTRRLAYESQHLKAKPMGFPEDRGTVQRTLPANSPAALDRLDRVEREIDRHNDFDARRRVLSLEQLHAGRVQQFVDSQGFGVGRKIMRPSPSYVEFRNNENSPIPQYHAAGLIPPESRATSESPPADQGVLPSSPQVVDDLLNMHVGGLVDFADPRGFGYVRDRDHVVGFRAHHFREAPRYHGSEHWQIQSLELVSLLRHEEPAAYLSQFLPRMDELRDARTRPLDPFERTALAVLNRGEDLHVQRSAGSLRMVGSIRATSQCLRCHQVERGDLLGAFTYRLKREP